MKNIFFLLILYFFSCKGKDGSGANAKPEDTNPKDTAGVVHRIPIDSTYFLDKEISAANRIFLDKASIARVYGYAHQAYEIDTGKVDKEFILCDSLSILHPKKWPKDRVELSGPQVNKLLTILNSPSNFQGSQSGCFFPRHTFVFVNPDNKICGFVQICFQCSQVYSEPFFSNKIQKDGLLTTQGSKALMEFCNETGIITEL